MFKEFFLRQLYRAEDYYFEKKMGVELSGIINSSQLVTKFTSKSHAVEYRAVYTRNLRVLLNEAKKKNETAQGFDNFIDIGSGKGKACFYAHSKKIADNIIGVEFSDELIEISYLNNKIIKAKNINFINADALEYLLPCGNNLIFMFNPFDDYVMRKFIVNNLNNFKKNKTIIAYANDIHRNIFRDFDFETIFRDQERMISLYKLN
jgi:hypothetical protein